MDKMTMEEKHLRAVIYPTAGELERMLILYIERTCSIVLKELFDKIKEARESYNNYLDLDYALQTHLIFYLKYKGYRIEFSKISTVENSTLITTIKF